MTVGSSDLAALARRIIDDNLYLTLATADRDGRPWATPVFFASPDHTSFFWASMSDAEHSRNLAERPQVSIVIFDSTVPPYTGEAVYASGDAVELGGDDLAAGLLAYPGASSHGAAALELADVSGDSPYRLYRLTASQTSVLCPRPPRQPCPVHGIAADHRAVVTL